jgi:L-lactate dehydrogenase
MEKSTVLSPARVAIVGLGNVGATFAYPLLISGLAPEIVLIDANKKKAEGEAMDLNHAMPFFRPVRVWAGDYADCAGAAVTVICAGASQNGGTRLDLVEKNARIFASIVPQIVQHNPEGIILVATNPVDVLAYATWKLSGLEANRVIGSGTILDTARLHYLLGQHYGVDARSIHGFIIGEHGDSEVPVWSLANIAGMRLSDYAVHQKLEHEKEELDEIFRQTRDAAYHIVECKGATYYAVAAGLMRIMEAILRDQRTVLCVSSVLTGQYGIHDVCLSLPTIVHRAGVERVLELELNAEEEAKLRHSAQVLRQTIESLHWAPTSAHELAS